MTLSRFCSVVVKTFGVAPTVQKRGFTNKCLPANRSCQRARPLLAIIIYTMQIPMGCRLHSSRPRERTRLVVSSLGASATSVGEMRGIMKQTFLCLASCPCHPARTCMVAGTPAQTPRHTDLARGALRQKRDVPLARLPTTKRLPFR